MKGQAYIVSGKAIGTGNLMGGISGRAATFGMTKGSGTTTPTVNGEGERTRERLDALAVCHTNRATGDCMATAWHRLSHRDVNGLEMENCLITKK